MPGAISILPEPELEFRYGQRMHDPHAGLALVGPYDADAASHPRSVTYGVIGTPEGIAEFEAFASAIADPIVSQPYSDPEGDRKSHLLWPPFPGFEAAFASTWKDKPAWSRSPYPVELIIRKLSEGATEAVLLDAYPRLTQEDIPAVLAYTAKNRGGCAWIPYAWPRRKSERIMELESYFEFIGNDAIRIAGTRVGIEMVLRDYREGASPEEIVLRYPTLSLEQIHAHYILPGKSREGGAISRACERATGTSLGGTTTPPL